MTFRRNTYDIAVTVKYKYLREKEIVMDTKFHLIDYNNWERRQYFYYFTKMLPTGYSISVDIDITNTYNIVKSTGRKFFPTYLYLASKLIAKQQEFRIAKSDEQLGYYDVLHPSYACFHEDDKTISSMWTQYDEDYDKFYMNYQKDQEQFANNHGVLAKPDMPPANNYMIGMLPWTQFTSYTPTPYTNSEYYFPVLEAGKFFEKENRKMMPFSISIHHAVADGYHVGLFLERFQYGMEHPKEWM